MLKRQFEQLFVALRYNLNKVPKYKAKKRDINATPFYFFSKNQLKPFPHCSIHELCKK